MRFEDKEVREPVPVPVHRQKPAEERKVPDELPDRAEPEIRKMPRRWYVY